MTPSSLMLYARSIARLKPIQIYFLIKDRLGVSSNPRSTLSNFCLHKRSLKKPVFKYLGKNFPYEIEFFGVKTATQGDKIWVPSKVSKLWLYNLHYFDFLVSEKAFLEPEYSIDIIKNWIDECPVGQATSWDSYTTSLRIVNWIKFLDFSRASSIDETILCSLGTQVTWLNSNIEWHIQANHLFANLKAIIFGGCYFRCNLSNSILLRAINLLNEQISTQILNDGGHFERSPMYHSIILEDLLDIVNLAICSENDQLQKHLPFWMSVCKKMFHWLGVIIHPNNELPFFNDSCLNVAAQYTDLTDYGTSLGLDFTENKSFTEPKAFPNSCLLQNSGFWRANSKNMSIIFDVGEVKSTFQPGHTHAETLAIEVYAINEKVIGNGGISTYEKSPLRFFQRSSQNHSTIIVDNKNSSQVWSSFRLAKSAKIQEQVEACDHNSAFMVASHDGYSTTLKRVETKRKVTVKYDTISILDTLDGTSKEFTSRYILHPEINVISSGLQGDLILETPLKKIIKLQIHSGQLNFAESSYSEGFGSNIPTKVLDIFSQNGKTEITLQPLP